MNRRGFLGSLAAAAIAPFLPKPKPKYEHKVFRSPEITYSKDDFLWLDDEGGLVSVDEFAEAAREAGESFRMSKGLVGWEGIVGRKGT